MATDTSVASNPQSQTKPPLALRVGVVGHRPKRLQQANPELLSGVLSKVLAVVKAEVERTGSANESYSTKGRLIAISPLAEGADRFFAKAALGLKFELCCVMPFEEDTFRKDFVGREAAPGALAEFDEILTQARSAGGHSIFQLDGDYTTQETRELAYATAGQVVVNQSDLLIVIWDGERTKAVGGTEQAYDEARRQGVPIIRIEAAAPHAWSVEAPSTFDSAASESGAHRGPMNLPAIREQVRALLKVSTQGAPVAAKSYGEDAESASKGLKRFFQEAGSAPEPPRRLAIVGEACLAAGGRKPTSDVLSLVHRLNGFFVTPDKLGILYARRLRDTFKAMFSLAAFAVAMALLPVAFPADLEVAEQASEAEHSLAEKIGVGAEFVSIVCVLALVFWGNRRLWHKRWIDYRLAAELVRSLSIVAPLGGTRPFTQLPKKGATHGQPSTTWMAWYLRAIDRELGLPSVKVNQEHLLGALAYLRAVVTDQHAYHEKNAHKLHHREHVLHHLGILCFGGSLLACVLHIPGLFHLSFAKYLPSSNVLIFFSACLPAVGAAFNGIKNQGEYRRFARRSRAMAEKLKSALDEIETMEHRVTKRQPTQNRQLSTDVARLLEGWAQFVVGDVLDWRVAFLDRPLEPPA